MKPFINLFGTPLPSYFLFIAGAFCVGVIYFRLRASAQNLPAAGAMDLSIILMVSGFLGSRVFHILYEQPKHYLNNPIEVLYIWQGGFVFYGGAILSLLSGWVYARYRYPEIEKSKWFFALAPVVPLVYSIGRVGTFFSGSGYGKRTESPFAVVFPPGTEAPSGVPVHPTQLYSAVGAFLIVIIVLWYERRGVAQRFHPFAFMAILFGLNRIAMEFFRDDFRGQNPMGLSISTWMSGFIIVISIISARTHRRT